MAPGYAPSQPDTGIWQSSGRNPASGAGENRIAAHKPLKNINVHLLHNADIVAAQRLTGEPGVAGGLGQGVAVVVDHLPGLLTDYHMEAEVAAPAPALVEGVIDGVDPGKALAAAPPVTVEIVGLQGVQRVVFPALCSNRT